MHLRMRAARWALLAMPSAGAIACGGAGFTATHDDQSEAPGNGGGQKPLGSAGGDGGDSAAGSAQGGSVATEPTPTDVMGEGGALPDGPRGSAGDGGIVGEEPGVVLDLTDCGADAFGTGIMPTLYSTLDSSLAITSPQIGELGFVSNGENDYHGDHCGTGISIDDGADYIKYHYQDNQVRHFDPLVGAMDFWYRPSYPHTDGLDHHLFSTVNWETVGGIRIRKAAADNFNAFQVILRGAALEQLIQVEVPADEYTLTPARWTRITLIWHLAPTLPEKYVRVFIDGQLVGQVLPPNSFQMAPDPNGIFLLGAWDFGDAQNAAGWLDDFKVFPRGP